MLRTPAAVAFHDLLPAQAGMREEICAGLRKARKEISPKYFYDPRGCELFEAICHLPEYYPTRTELAIMQKHAAAMAAALGHGATLIEIGCGNSEKTRALLDELAPRVFVAVDIAREQLEASCSRLATDFPQMKVVAVRADFAGAFDLPVTELGGTRRILYFPGSTIGNFTPDEARAFLARWVPALGPGGGALIGVDLKKDAAVLDAAYDDAQGVTAQFNLNVLTHINRALGADFDVTRFRHRARYVPAQGRIEMHLESLTAQRVTIGAQVFDFRAGETIHTENSYKYSIDEFRALARDAGYEPRSCWSDDASLFAVHELAVAARTL